MLRCLNCRYTWNDEIAGYCPRCGSIRVDRPVSPILIAIAWFFIGFAIFGGSVLLSEILFLSANIR